MGELDLRFEGAERATFTSAVGFADGAIDARPQSPEHSLARFDIVDEILTIATMSPDQTRWTTMKVPGVADGSFAVPCRLLFQLLRNLPDGPLRLTVGKRVEVRTGRLRFGLQQVDHPGPLEMPEAGSADTVTVRGAVLARAATKAAKCTAVDPDNAISGVHVSCDGTAMRFAATDGNRLIALDVDVIGGAETSALLSAPVLASIAADAASHDEVTVELSDGYARFTFGEHVVVSRLLAKSFPAYQTILTAHEVTTTIEVADRKPLGAQIDRLVLVGQPFQNGVVVELTADPDRGVSLVSAQQDGNDGDGSFDPELYPVAGDTLTLKFMSGFLKSGLELAEGPVSISLHDPLKPLLVDGGTVDGVRFRYVLMPVR